MGLNNQLLVTLYGGVSKLYETYMKHSSACSDNDLSVINRMQIMKLQCYDDNSVL